MEGGVNGFWNCVFKFSFNELFNYFGNLSQLQEEYFEHFKKVFQKYVLRTKSVHQITSLIVSIVAVL